MSFKYATFSGGGAKGAAYAGAYWALIESEAFDKLEEVSGSSAGAIVAAFAAAGVSKEKFKEIMQEKNFENLLGDRVSFFGIEKTGHPLQKLIKDTINQSIVDYIKEKINNFNINGNISGLDLTKITTNENKQNQLKLILKKIKKNEEITFGDLSVLHEIDPTKFKKLHVTAVEQDTGNQKIFSTEAEDTKNVGIATACRASASIPVLLKPVEIHTDNTSKKYVDGGLYKNIPTNVFYKSKVDQKEQIKVETLVFAFGEGKDHESPLHKALNQNDDAKIYNPGYFERFKRNTLVRWFGGVQAEYNNTDRKDKDFQRIRKHFKENTVELKVGDVKTTDFDKAQINRDKLFYEGYFATRGLLFKKEGAAGDDKYKLKKFIFEVFKNFQEDSTRLSIYKTGLDSSLKAKKLLNYCDIVGRENVEINDDLIKNYLKLILLDRSSNTFKSTTRSLDALIKTLNSSSDTMMKQKFCAALESVDYEEGRKFTRADFKNFVSQQNNDLDKKSSAKYICYNEYSENQEQHHQLAR